MELHVLTSKKGTKVVTASNLYGALELPEYQYSTMLSKWINDFYEFSDGIRKPILMKDFARRKIADNPVLKDYYLSVEFARKLTLRSKSKLKRKFANKLSVWQERATKEDSVSLEQIQTLMEICKMMTSTSFQESAERRHREFYSMFKSDEKVSWRKHRSEVLGYAVNDLRREMEMKGKDPKGKNRRQMLIILNKKSELVRTGVIDLLVAMGKSNETARMMGDIAGLIAKEAKLDVYDDRESGNLFASSINTSLLNDLKNYRHAAAL